LESIVKNIVEQAKALKDRHTNEGRAPVNYSCIFSYTSEEYSELVEACGRIGTIVESTPTGPLFNIRKMATAAGPLRLLKVRVPDKTRSERGDADFTVGDYNAFKKECLARKGFKLIIREKMEMVELMEDGCEVRAYFSNPTLERILGI